MDRAERAPSGEVRINFLSAHIGGPITCLAVSGNTAIIKFDDQGNEDLGTTEIQVVDGQPDTFHTGLTDSPTDCSPGTPSFGGPVSGGDFTVVDAQPFPTAKGQCRDGGWQSFGSTFKNQGQCVAFVKRQSRQECIFERAAHGVAAFRAKYGQGNQKRHAMRSCVRLRVNS